MKEGEIRYIVVICRKNQMFDSRNNIVWRVKQYCLRWQTQVFDAWNNIVWRYKHATFSVKWNVYASKSAYLFLKKPTLPVFPKIRVSRKRQKYRFCQANSAFCSLSVLRNLYIRGEAVLSSLLLLFPKRKITSSYLYQTRKKTRIFENTPVKNTEIYAIPILFPSRFILNS